MTLRLNGDNSGFTEIKAADAAGDNSIKLPASNGSANQLLQNGGTAGELQYTSAGGGLHYDSSGRLLVGTSSARDNIYNHLSGLSNQFQIEGTGYTNSAMLIVRNSNNASDGGIVIGKTRGTAVGSNTIVQDDDTLGEISFQGADGSALVSAAEINAEVDGTPSTAVMPAKLVFSTNGGSSAPTPRMEIGSNGALKLLSGCPGIDFSGIQTNAGGMTSELFDSYEEGTFTPTVGQGSSTALSNVTYSRRQGTYVKIGRIVYFILDIASTIDWGNVSASSEGFTIQGLPFTHDQIGPTQIGSKFANRIYFSRHWSTPWPTSQSPSNDAPNWSLGGSATLYSQINRNGNTDYTYTISDWDAAAGNTTRTFELQVGGTYTTEG